MKFSVASAAAAALGLASTVSAASVERRQATDPIVIKGAKMFHKNSGDQFFMKGVAYQADLSGVDADKLKTGQLFVDPLADVAGCKRDIPLLQALNTNLIRVYAIDTTKSHDECMKMLVQAGIYVVADLSEPGLSINRDAPTWDYHLYERYTAVIDELQQYDNVMGFFAGNEVTNNKTNVNASPFVKAAVRDMKAYIKQKGYRQIPVGYATNDDEEIRDQMANYFDCGPSESAVDFWGYNIYSWCGQSSLQISGWDKRTEEYKDYNVPVFFAEYGCNEVQPRKFSEVAALYGNVMSPVFSGGIVYMYFEEANNYGLVTVDGSGKASKLADYGYLQTALAKATPSSVAMNAYKPSNTARACPTQDSVWPASTALPPTPDEQLCQCVKTQFECVPAKGVKEEDYAEIFAYICGQLGDGGCDGIITDGNKGIYGSYSMCESEIRLGWALNAYYNAQGKAQDACNFSGQAELAKPTTLNSTCATQVQNAGGVTGKAVTDGSSTSSSAQGKSSGKPNAGVALSVPFVGLNALAVVAASFLAGVAML
ncbi:1,3-beta-glucanosyltransferase gas1 [Orbilia brochopaga]|uniref:1,3-beta-glucanosyltransferase n=1 Tax=Orbilia brochopaga TaxID=3140254 RepID=A0AAV9UVQ1_9PEZI